MAIRADTVYFQSYKEGVLTDAEACGTQVNHAVTVVGYGSDRQAGEYYLVRNSWGESWGDSGYVKIGTAEGEGICGINQFVAFADVN